MSLEKDSTGVRLACSGRDPVVDPLTPAQSYGVWEKFEPAFDFIPSVVPEQVERIVVAPLAKAVLQDPKRDSIVVRRMLLWSVTNVPLAAFILFYMECTTFNYIFFTALNILLWFASMDAYVLGLHLICHRGVFKGIFSDLLYHYYSTILGPLFGETPETYYVHHIGMHHTYNNHFKDLSSTMKFQRDSFRDWLRYLGEFLVVHAPLYKLFKDTNPKLTTRFFAGEIGWASFVLYCFVSRPYPTFVVLIFPVLTMRVGMMAGNWGQHAFINPDEPTTNFGHSVNIIDSVYNRRCYNDGYHIMHHLYPSAHYTDLPQLFCSEVKLLAQHDCVVFSHSHWDFVSIWFHLMRNDYDTLAKHFVHLDPTKYVLKSYEDVKTGFNLTSNF